VRREKIGEERFMWFIGGAFLLLVLGAGLRPGALRLSGAVTGLIFCVGLARAAEDWKQEVERLASEQASKPDDLGLAERLGEALFRAGDYDRAQEVLEGVAERSVDPAQRQRARYNGGLAAYRGGQLTRALEDWQRVQQDNPEHAAAKQNAEAVQKELSARTQPPEEQPQQGQPGEGEPQEGQEGQPQEGQQGQPQSGEQSQDGAQPADPGEGQSTEEGQPPIGERGEIEGEAGTAGEDADAGEPTDANGDITAREAERLLDGVQEGSPRIRTSDRPRSGKDW
jgi:Ca-activated chloride channel family protein